MTEEGALVLSIPQVVEGHLVAGETRDFRVLERAKDKGRYRAGVGILDQRDVSPWGVTIRKSVEVEVIVEPVDVGRFVGLRRWVVQV